MTKKKLPTPKKKLPSPKSSVNPVTSQAVRKSNRKKSPKVVKKVTTVETRGTDGVWSKTTVIKYVKSLWCPAFLKNEMVVTLAAIPLAILILAILWKITHNE